MASSSDFIRVYRKTLSGTRILFIFRRSNIRLSNIPPFTEVGFISFDPIRGEIHSIAYDPNYSYLLQKEVWNFQAAWESESSYRTLCEMSYDKFLSLLQHSDYKGSFYHIYDENKLF